MELIFFMDGAFEKVIDCTISEKSWIWNALEIKLKRYMELVRNKEDNTGQTIKRLSKVIIRESEELNSVYVNINR